MDGGAWWAAVHGVAKSGTWLSYFTFTFHFQALEKDMATHSSVLAWRIPGTGRTWLSNFTFTFHFHAMEDMATHSSVLAWRISGMGEPGGLLSVGSQIVGHDWSELTAVAAAERFEEWLKLLPHSLHLKGFSPVWILCPGSSTGKESTCNVGDPGSIPGSGSSPGEGKGYAFQYSGASLVA